MNQSSEDDIGHWAELGFLITPQDLADIVSLYMSGEISFDAGKKVIRILWDQRRDILLKSH